jgi:Flp pilus assembly protein TadD
MARIHRISIPVQLAVLVGAFLSAASPAVEPTPWFEIHSTHFTVITDAGDKKGREVALRFEQMRAVFASLLMKERLNQPLPLTILAFRSDKSYYQSAPLKQGQPIDVPGFFLPGEDQNFIVLNLFEAESWRAVAHDFAHLLLNYNYPALQDGSSPGWFDEGLAEYFSSIRLDDKKYEIGGDPELTPLFTQDLLENQHESRNPPKSLTELLGGQVWLALPDLLTMKHDTSTYNEGTRHTLFYAQSWMTMHYLLHEQKMPQTGAYFNLVENQHVPVEEAIQQAYGMTPDEFDRAVKAYFHSLTPLFVALDASKQPNALKNTPQVYEFPEMVGANDSVITAMPMRESDALALVDEMKIRIPDRREVGLKDLEALATAPDPAAAKRTENNRDDKTNPLLVTAAGDEIAHRALAWDHIQVGEFDAATEELSDAAALNQHDPWISYYVSQLKYRTSLAKHTEIAGLPNMLQDLRAVLDWYPEFADAYDLMAIARMQAGGPAAAMQAEHAAMQLSPRNQQYVYHLAEIYVEDKKWDAARAVLDRLKTSSKSQIAAEARERLATLGNEQKYGISSASSSPGEKLSPQSSPFDVLEQDAAKRAATTQAAQSDVADKRPTKFFQGRVVDVDCSQSPAAVLTVTSGKVVLKLRTADYKSLLLIGAGTFSCAWNDRSVSVNYKPGGGSDGDLVSVEMR